MKTKLTFLTLLIAIGFNQLIYGINVPENETKGNKGGIAGRVIDQDNLPLPGATVYIKSINEGAISDVNGYFRLAKLAEGDYELEISYIGFKKSSQMVSVKAGETSKADFLLEAGIDLGEVVVNGSLQGQSKALNQQRNSVNITNIISSDQVGRFPDSNVGDALKRIPGINVQYDQGEARFGHIRGTSPELNSVSINGDRIPSAEAEIRAVQLDLVPSDMIQTIEVSKVVTPDMDADAIGGSINLVTKSSPYKRRVSGTIGSGYNLLSEKAALNASLVYGDRFANDKLGMIFSASYQDNKLGSDNIEAEWEEDGQVYVSDFQVRTYQVRRERQSYSASFDYVVNVDHKLDFKAIYNHRKDWENRFRLRFKDIEQVDGEWVAEIRRQTKGGTPDHDNARLEDQKTMNFSLGGEHHFGSIKLDWRGSYAKASEERPNERYIAYRAKNAPLSVNLSDAKKPKITSTDIDKLNLGNEYGLKELTEQFQYTDDIDKNLRIDLSIPMAKGDFKNKLKAGMKFKGKEKSRDNKFKEYEPTDEDAFDAASLADVVDKTKSNFLAGDYVAGKFVSKSYLGSLDFENTSKFIGTTLLEELAGNFDAKENVAAAYLRLDQELGQKLSVVAGLRMEHTSLEYSGRELEINEDGDQSLKTTPVEKDKYTSLLPSFIAKYSFSENSKLKLAFTNTIARPKYFDLVPHVEINLEDLEINLGNPALEPTQSMNFDLMAEHYFKSIGMLSGGVFYKNISDFIVTKVLFDEAYLGTVYDKFSKPINAGDADLLGFELAFQRQFDFLSGFLKQVGFYANYTYTHSKVGNFAIEGRENEDLSLPGTPKNIVNTSLYYEGDKLSIRASLNYSDAFIDEVGESAFYDHWYDKATYLDMNASYQVSKKLRIFAEANNLLNTPLRYYQGVSERTLQAEYYNTKINFGLKFDL